MDAIWSTLDRAWIWRDGGRFFGVPLSNFVGWYFTAFLFYLAFAIYCRKRPTPMKSGGWRAGLAGGHSLLRGLRLRQFVGVPRGAVSGQRNRCHGKAVDGERYPDRLGFGFASGNDAGDAAGVVAVKHTILERAC